MFAPRLSASIERALGPWSPSLASPPDFPNRFALPRSEQPQLVPAGKLLAALFALALIPRLIMAWKLPSICPDGIYFLQLAKDLESGNPVGGFRMQLNIYPMILAGLHHLGLPWELSAKLWGVCAASLAVLPLFGWARRQFDDRVATVACVLYAVHPELIEWSPEVVRDSTFWLLFASAIYFGLRAMLDVSWLRFVLAVAAITLASLTRFEGIFLFVLLGGLTAVRCVGLQAGRRYLVVAALGSMLAMPLLIAALNLFWFGHRADAHWESFRLEPLRRAVLFVQSWREPIAKELPAMASPELGPPQTVAPIGADPNRWPLGKLAWNFVHMLERGTTPLHGLLLLGGTLAWSRIAWRRDMWPGMAFVAATLGGIWVHLWYTHLASSRYSLSVVIITLPLAALGLLSFGRTLGRLLQRHNFERQHLGWATVGTALLLLVVGWTDALSTEYRARAYCADLGRWIHERYGQLRLIVGTYDQMNLIAYYAETNGILVPPGTTDEQLAASLQVDKPDLVVLARRTATSAADRSGLALRSDPGKLGLEIVNTADLPHLADKRREITVLSRARLPVAKATSPSQR